MDCQTVSVKFAHNYNNSISVHLFCDGYSCNFYLKKYIMAYKYTGGTKIKKIEGIVYI